MVSKKKIKGSEARSPGNAAEDRLPLKPHEGRLRRKAGERAESSVLGYRPDGSVAVIRQLPGGALVNGMGEYFAYPAPVRTAG